MNSQTFFSVIIPTFNRRPFLEKAVNSVLSQNYRKYELIIIDDGSTDSTQELLENYNDKRIVYKKIPHSGVSSARNKGLELSTGDFIAFLDSDDWWKENKLSVTAAYIQQYPDLKIFHTEEVWFKNGKKMPQKKKHRKPDGKVYSKALSLCCISISTASVKKDVFDEIGVFDEALPACEDYDFWLRSTNKYPVKLIKEELTLKDGGRKDQLSSSVWGLDRFRIKSLEKMLLSGSLTFSDRRKTISELKKKCRIFAKGAKKRGREDSYRRYLLLPEKFEI